MSRITFGGSARRVHPAVKKDKISLRSPEDVARELKQGRQKHPGDDYRERALAIYGLICARCGREFDNAHRQLLTVHHKDGNHQNNPPDGSNWESLCVYCHEDAHSREMLGHYLEGTAGGREETLVYKDGTRDVLGTLADKMKKILEDKPKFRS